MPLALAIVAALIFMTAIRGNYSAVGQQFNATVFGGTDAQGNAQAGFLKWAGSIFGLAIIFRIIGAPRAGELFIALLILVYFLDNQGVLAQIEADLAGASNSASASAGAAGSATPAPPAAPDAPQAPAAPTAPQGDSPAAAPVATPTLPWYDPRRWYDEFLGTRPAQ